MEQVEVTDSDREALAATVEDMGLLSSLTASHIRQGLYDNDCGFIAKARIEATRTTDQAKDEEIARLKSALEEIVNPVAAMQRRAEADGKKLSGMAWEIARNPSYLQGIAKEALGGSIA